MIGWHFFLYWKITIKGRWLLNFFNDFWICNTNVNKMKYKENIKILFFFDKWNIINLDYAILNFIKRKEIIMVNFKSVNIKYNRGRIE